MRQVVNSAVSHGEEDSERFRAILRQRDLPIAPTLLCPSFGEWPVEQSLPDWGRARQSPRADLECDLVRANNQRQVATLVEHSVVTGCRAGVLGSSSVTHIGLRGLRDSVRPVHLMPRLKGELESLMDFSRLGRSAVACQLRCFSNRLSPPKKILGFCEIEVPGKRLS